METQATRSSLAHKVIAVAMAIVLAVGLCPMLPYGAAPAYADDLAAGQITTQSPNPEVSSGLADGTYTVKGIESSFGMFHFGGADSKDANGLARVVVRGNEAYLITVVTDETTIKRYDGMASGAQSKILDTTDATNKTLVAGTPIATTVDETSADKITKRTFILPVEKNVLAEGGKIFYMVKYCDGYSETHDGDWYEAKQDNYFSGYTLEKENESTILPAPLKLTLENSVSMFSLTGAELSADGTQVSITTKSVTFSKVALSKKRKADDEESYEFPKDGTTVTIPASKLGGGKQITTSWWSIKNEDWYERDLVFDAQKAILTFVPTETMVDFLDKYGNATALKAAIDDKSLVVTPELVDDAIAAIQVQVRNDKTDFYCEAAKILWDALSKEDQEKVEEGGYFADPTGDASKDDPLNQDNIGENEILVVSFGTSFNDSRVATIGGVEKALAEAFPGWSVRRAFTAQIIINHIQARDGEKIDNVQQAMNRAVANGVKNLIVQPTHLMHGAEYDELKGEIDKYTDKMEIIYSEPLLGQVGEKETDTNPDKLKVAEEAVKAAVADAKYANLTAAEADGAAFVFMGHGTGHDANISYFQMRAAMSELGYKNVFVGTVEGEELKNDTACSAVLAAVKTAGYKKIFLRPLMVVAGDHANNDMADENDPESWCSQFKADGSFTSIECQIKGLGEIPEIQQLYVAHVNAAAGDKIAEQKSADESAAKTAADAITNLPADVTTEDGKKAVAEARAAYDKLTDYQKTLVDEKTLENLTKAEDSVKKAEEAAGTKTDDGTKTDTGAGASTGTDAKTDDGAYDGTKADDAAKAGTGASTGKTTNSAFKISKAKKSFKASKSKKKVFKATKLYKISGAKMRNITFKKANNAGAKKITVAKNGNITVKKGLKAAKYDVKVKATVKATAKYKKTTKAVTVRIVVK